MKRPEFGVRAPVAGPLASGEAVRRTAAVCEELGYDAIWVHDFIVWNKYLDRTHVSCGSIEAVQEAGEDARPNFFDSLTNLAFLAGITEKIKIGVAVLGIPYRNPILTAKQLATIDVLSDGRLILGAGVGGPKTTHNVDFEVLGISRAEKYERTRDHLRAMIHTWTSDDPYQGAFVSFQGAEFSPRPIQKPHPPIWVSGKMDRSLDMAAELGTGWFAPWFPPEEYPARIADLRERARAKGRDIDHHITTEVYVCIDEDAERARAAAIPTLKVLNVNLMTSGLAQDATRLVGSPDEIVAKLERYVAAGVQHYEMKFIYHTIDHLERQLRLFAREVLPRFATVPLAIGRTPAATPAS